MGKPKSGVKPPPNAYSNYRDEPGRDDAAFTSSAVPMSDIEYPEEETPLTEGFPEDQLPAYSDVPALSVTSSEGPPIPIS